MSSSTFDRVLRIIAEWHPKKDYRSEAGYRDDLMGFIRRELKKGSMWGLPERHRIRKESGRHLADIGIDDKIAIELKRNLDTQSRLHRLIGQIRMFMRSYSYIIIVLCGQINEEILDELRHEFRKYSVRGLWQPQTVIKIVPKKTIQKKKEPTSFLGLLEEAEHVNKRLQSLP